MATATELELHFENLTTDGGDPGRVLDLAREVRGHIEHAHRTISLGDGAPVSVAELREGRAELERLRCLLRRIEVYVTPS